MSAGWLSIQEDNDAQRESVARIPSGSVQPDQISMVVIKQNLIKLANNIQARSSNVTLDNSVIDELKELNRTLSSRPSCTSTAQQQEYNNLSFLIHKLSSDYLTNYVDNDENVLSEAYQSTLSACKLMHHTGHFDHSLLLRLANQAMRKGDLQTSKHILSVQRLRDSILPGVWLKATSDLACAAMEEKYTPLDAFASPSSSGSVGPVSSRLTTQQSAAEFAKDLLTTIFRCTKDKSFRGIIEELEFSGSNQVALVNFEESVEPDTCADPANGIAVVSAELEATEYMGQLSSDSAADSAGTNTPAAAPSDAVSTRARRKGAGSKVNRGADDEEAQARPITAAAAGDGETAQETPLQQTILGILTSDGWCPPEAGSTFQSLVSSSGDDSPKFKAGPSLKIDAQYSERETAVLFSLAEGLLEELQDELRSLLSVFFDSSSDASVDLSLVDLYNIHKLTFTGLSTAMDRLQKHSSPLSVAPSSAATTSNMWIHVPLAVLLCWRGVVDMNGGQFAVPRLLGGLSTVEAALLIECSVALLLSSNRHDVNPELHSIAVTLTVDLVDLLYQNTDQFARPDCRGRLRMRWCALLLTASPRVPSLPLRLYDQLDSLARYLERDPVRQYVTESLKSSPLLLPHMPPQHRLGTLETFNVLIETTKAMKRSKLIFSDVEYAVSACEESQLPILIESKKDILLNIELLVERCRLAASNGEAPDDFILTACFQRILPRDTGRLEPLLSLLSTWWSVLHSSLPRESRESPPRLARWLVECDSKVSECIASSLSLFPDESFRVGGDICAQFVSAFSQLYESLIRARECDLLASIHTILEALVVNEHVAFALGADDNLEKMLSVVFGALARCIKDVQFDHSNTDARLINSIHSISNFLCKFIYLATDRRDFSDYFLTPCIDAQAFILTLVTFAQTAIASFEPSDSSDVSISLKSSLFETINNCLAVVYYLSWFSGTLSLHSALDVIFVTHEFVVSHRLFECDAASSLLWLANQLFKPIHKLLADTDIHTDGSAMQASNIGCPFLLTDASPNILRDLVHHLAEIYYLAYSFPLAANLISDAEPVRTLTLHPTPSAGKQMYTLLQLGEKMKALNFSRSNFRLSYLMLYECHSGSSSVVDFNNSVLSFLLHHADNSNGIESDPMSASKYFEFITSSVPESSINRLTHSTVAFDLGLHLLKHGGTFPFFGPNCACYDSDSVETTNRKRLCGAIQLFVESLAAAPLHLPSWIGLHKACSDRLSQVMDLIAESFVVLDIPSAVLANVNFLSSDEMFFAMCDGSLADEQSRGKAIYDVIKHDPAMDMVRQLCQDIGPDPLKRKLPHDFSFDADGRCIVKQPRLAPATALSTDTNTDAVDVMTTYSENQTERAIFALLHMVGLKNAYANAIKNCVEMIQLLGARHDPRVTLPFDPAVPSALSQIFILPYYEEDINAVLESYALLLYNLSLEYPKSSGERRQLQNQSLVTFKTGIYFSLLFDYLVFLILIYTLYFHHLVLETAASTRKLFHYLMIGKLTRQLYKADIRTSLAYLGAANALLATDEVRAAPSLKTTRVAVLYQLQSVRVKACVDHISDLCYSFFGQLRDRVQTLTVSINLTVLELLERLDDNNKLSLEENLNQSNNDTMIFSRVSSVSEFQLTLHRLGKILTHAFWKLRECRKLDNFEAFSVYRISDVILRLSSLKSSLKAALSETPSKNESDAWDVFSDWMCSVANSFQLPDLSTHEAQVELRKLFDKRRQQIVGIW